MKVIATARGFDGSVVRNPGDVFEVADGKRIASWFKPAKAGADADKPAAKPGKARKDATAEALAAEGSAGTADIA